MRNQILRSCVMIVFIFSHQKFQSSSASLKSPWLQGRSRPAHFPPSSSRFSLDEETGWVILRAGLDYELMRRFTLTVLARDGGGEETTGRIRVNVLDVNDNAPLFQKEAYVGSLRENEQAVQPVARVRVRQPTRLCCNFSHCCQKQWFQD